MYAKRRIYLFTDLIVARNLNNNSIVLSTVYLIEIFDIVSILYSKFHLNSQRFASMNFKTLRMQRDMQRAIRA